jgi:hypothetical protein
MLNRKHHRSTLVSWGLLAAGIICLLIKALAPVTIGADGMLHEPFYLLIFGYVLAALVTYLGGAFWRRMRR